MVYVCKIIKNVHYVRTMEEKFKSKAKSHGRRLIKEYFSYL